MNDDARDLTRGGGAGRIALSYYAAFTGMLAAALLLMKLVVAVQSLPIAGPFDF
jgi:hypothetical protein